MASVCVGDGALKALIIAFFIPGVLIPGSTKVRFPGWAIPPPGHLWPRERSHATLALKYCHTLCLHISYYSLGHDHMHTLLIT